MKTALAVALIAAFPGADLTQLSDAPAGNPAISQDKRFGRLVAFEAGGNVYAVHRAEPYGENGTPWQAGRRELVSVGLGGAPANGPSTRAAVDGTSRVAPHCVAFVSAASNLVRGDTNGTPDAFVRDLRTGVTKRVSVNSRGRQSSGTVTEVAVDGLCRRAAFVSDATDLGLRKTKNRNWKTAVTRANLPGRRQVYLHFVRRHDGDRPRDEEARPSSPRPPTAGGPGTADSHSIAYSTNADRLTFASDAPNLSASDRNGATDIYQRSMSRRYGKKIKGRRVQYLRMDTRLVSAGANGLAGSGPSTQPASNVDGSIVAFATTAGDLVRTGGVAQIVEGRGAEQRRPEAARSPPRAAARPPTGERSAEPDGGRLVGRLRVRCDQRRRHLRPPARHQRRARRDARHRAVGRPLAARRAWRRRADHEPDDQPARQLHRVRARRHAFTCSTSARSSGRRGAPHPRALAVHRVLPAR